MKSTLTLVTSLLACAMAVPAAQAANLLGTGDTIVGGHVDGSAFVPGIAGEYDSLASNFPAGESADKILDGDPGTKYLNRGVFDNANLVYFGGVNTGFLVTPSAGESVATGIAFTTANDSPERDPSSYSLLGTNASGAALNDLASYTMIVSAGGLSLPEGRGESIALGFLNTASYASYLIYFDSLRGGATPFMQIADVQLTGTVGAAIPEPGSYALGAGMAAFAFVALRRFRGPVSSG